MVTEKKIIVLCPGNIVTGGPELLHQLVDALRSVGHQAFICYFPTDRHFECPAAYAKYDAPQIVFEDTSSSIFVLPEVATKFLKYIRSGQVYIWWLSVDNFLMDRRKTLFKRLKLLVRMLLMRKHKHIVQSHYAGKFLRQYGIESANLSDYLNAAHFESKSTRERQNQSIAFNPKKGGHIIDRLRIDHPDLHFKAIENMTSNEVAALLSRVEIYVDFGHHPGRDRVPREAAMAGCCIITNRRGAAAYQEDVPIPEKYKLDDSSADFSLRFRQLVMEIDRNFERHSEEFDAYRDWIRQEPVRFRKNLVTIFGASG